MECKVNTSATPAITLEQIARLMEQQSYIADEAVTMSVFLSIKLNKPLLVEGPAGVGKTEIAKVLAKGLNTDLIRLQCYEGLDAAHALYEWNYQRQILHLKMAEQEKQTTQEKEMTIFGEAFLLKRPLLQAITHHQAPVLLIDEIDRSDEALESFLLEILSDWQITIPEMGTIRAQHIPHVVLTGNRTRDLSEALRRRCLYLFIDYPDFDKEWAIVQSKVPGIDRQLAREITCFMQHIRKIKLEKVPGVAESVDWAAALAELHIAHLDREIVEKTLGVVVKDWQDTRQVQLSLSELLDKTGVQSRL